MTGDIAIVDTNVISYIFRRHTLAAEYKPILEKFEHRLISFQTLGELEFWTLKSSWGRRRRADLAYFIEVYDVAYPDERVCSLWAKLKAQRERAGRPIHPEDAWIAATALDLGCPLITHDASDFNGIDGLKVITSFTNPGR